MTKVRLLGPKPRLRRVLIDLQDLGLLHLTEPAAGGGVRPHALSPAERRRHRQLANAVAAIEDSLRLFEQLGVPPPPPGAAPPSTGLADGRVALLGYRLRARLLAMAERRDALGDERATLQIYLPLVDEFEQLLAGERDARRFSAYLLLLRAGSAASLESLQDSLTELFGSSYELRTRTLATGEIALLLLVPSSRADDVDRRLRAARVESAPVPSVFGGLDLIEALPRIRDRLGEVDDALAALADEVDSLAHQHLPALADGQRRFRDELLELDAQSHAAETARAFVIEGWLPAERLLDLERHMIEAHDGLVSTSEITRDQWYGDEAPVVLTNPTLFEPFERVTSLLPLPHYGTVDPTPFVAVFFPMLFGVVVGDVGYGAAMLLIALILARGAPRGGLRRDISRIAAAIACFTIIFGVLYGELLGDLGHHYLGMAPIWLDREEAVVPFLIVAVSLGLAHIIIGLILSAISQRRRDPRAAIGRGITLIMLLMLAIALLVVMEQLPSALFTPAIVALLVAFPVLLIIEGFTGLLELFSMVGHILSYARVMALGTASVMLAVVANRMAGAFASAAVGVAFALLFHLVNFAIALFSPTIHVLRLHYVEFFGTFYSPGGARYQPLAHWKPASAASS